MFKKLQTLPWLSLVWIATGLLLAIALRIPLLQMKSGDYTLLESWYQHIQKNPSFSVFKDSFYNYTPPYIYLLWCSYKLFHLPPLYGIKIVGILFEFLLALSCSWVVGLQKPHLRLISFFTILFSLTVFINSSFWGQADAIYTTFLVVSLYFLLMKRPTLSAIFFATAFAFKAQAVFFAPVFLIAFLLRQIEWEEFLSIPLLCVLVYLIWIFPAWLAGRDLKDLLTIYLAQADTYRGLAMGGIANFYQWLPNGYYSIFSRSGLALAAAGVFFMALVAYQNRGPLDHPKTVLTSLLATLMVPYWLPKMHERYFFPADIFSILFAFYFPRYFWVAIIVNLCSFFGYFPFLFGQSVSPPLNPSALGLVMLGVIAFIFWLWAKHLSISSKEDNPASPLPS